MSRYVVGAIVLHVCCEELLYVFRGIYSAAVKSQLWDITYFTENYSPISRRFWYGAAPGAFIHTASLRASLCSTWYGRAATW